MSETILLSFVVTVMFTSLPTGEAVSLAIFYPDGNGIWLERAYVCRLDELKRCEIKGRAEAWQDGLLRGEIRSSLGRRPVIWPGGQLDLVFEPPLLPAEKSPYESPQVIYGLSSLPQQQLPSRQPRQRQPPAASWLLFEIGVVFGFFWYVSFRARGK